MPLIFLALFAVFVDTGRTCLPVTPGHFGACLMVRSLLLGLLFLFAIGLASSAHAQGSDGYWLLDFNSRSGAALKPLVIGIDSGKGFGSIAVSDDDNDGVIHLPPIPNGAGLALEVDFDGEVYCCDLYDLVGAQVYGVPGATISRPILIISEDAVEGEHLGMDSGAFPLPPLRTLTPGERLTATNGQLADWPDLRLVNADASVTTLDEYLRRVDTLPNFSGDVIVTDFLLTGIMIPEPSSLLLASLAGLICCSRRRR